MIKQACLYAIIAGKVQGVWFRVSAKKEAERLGLTGWAKNLPDGTVEVMACGQVDKLTEYKHWLWQGPPKAEVVQVTAKECPWQVYPKFEVR